MRTDSPVFRGVRFLRRWQAAGYGEARRRLHEERVDGQIREELHRHTALTDKERKALQAAAEKENLRFRAVFLNKEVPGEAREAASRSLREQILPAAEGPDADYTVFLEPDGILHPGALSACAKAIRETGTDLLYSDEDYYVNKPGDAFRPFFKPDYGPDTLRGCDYIGPFLACSASLLREAGAEELAELDEEARRRAVRVMAVKAKKICHIPKLLYYRKVPSAEEIPQPALTRVRDEIAGEPLVSILIPNKDHREDLKRCVDSVREKTDWNNYEIIVIENNSTDPATFRYYEELKKDPRIWIISREGAFNYSAVNNLGFREAKGEYILLLNNDTEVISGEWIREMLMYAQRPDVGAVGAKLYYPDGTIQHAGIGIGIMIAAGHYHRGFPGNSCGYFGRLSFAQDVSAVTGACMMIPRHVWEEMNGLDESFSIVFNDIDLCLRIREAGYLIVWTPWAELTHYESKSRGPEGETPEKKRFFVRETNRFLRRWHTVLEAGDPYYNPNLSRLREDFSLRGFDE